MKRFRFIFILLASFLYIPVVDGSTERVGSDKGEEIIEVVFGTSAKPQGHKKRLIYYRSSTDFSTRSANQSKLSTDQFQESKYQSIYLLNRCLLI
ncbi:MAG: hypothetical protein KF687_16395 [Cyclobacteriaceae bacterium]|nr:hypothetical protein [Cyclobacteriaceae bacterium]